MSLGEIEIKSGVCKGLAVLLISASLFSIGSNSFTAHASAALKPYAASFEHAGTVSKVYVKKGSTVSKGQLLAELDQSEASIAITKAKAQLIIAQAKLQKLQNSGQPAQSQTVDSATVNSALVALQNAKSSYDALVLEQKSKVNDAYIVVLNSLPFNIIPANTNTSTSKISITGTYAGTAPGTYVITATPQSSFNVSGLENQTDNIIAPNVPLPIGKGGLYITFSSLNVNAGDSWTINIPNTQSILYAKNWATYQDALASQQKSIIAAKNAISTAQAAYDLAVAKAQQKNPPPSPEDIQSAEATVMLAKAQVDSAVLAYARNQLRAPASGVVQMLNIAQGSSVVAHKAVLTIAPKKKKLF